MAEYISREATIEKLNKLCDRVCQYSKAQRKYMCGACPLGDAFTVIEDDIPTANVRPIIRGHWITEEEAEAKGNYLLRDTCSVCGHCDWDNTESKYFNFCPNCGADMRPTLMSGAKEES